MAIILGNNLNNLLLLGTEWSDSIFGYGGIDVLYGFAGNDTLDGGGDADTMFGGRGDDVYWVDRGDDRVVEFFGEGTDLVRSSVSFSLGLLVNVEHLGLVGTAAINGTGNQLNNTISGNAAANTLFGQDGNDQLIGGSGNDTLVGGTGNDTMFGDAGNDTFYVDASGDRVIEYAYLGSGIDTVWSELATYTLGNFVENLQLIGSAISGIGNSLGNSITGNSSHNRLFGRGGNDTLSGGNGSDWLDGGPGRDVMTGGPVGAYFEHDVFDFNNVAEIGNTVATRDVITDFVHLTDRIDLENIDANNNFLDGDQDFTFIGGALFNGAAAQIRFQWFDNPGTGNDFTVVYGERAGDGNAIADFQIQLNGLVNLTHGDFDL